MARHNNERDNRGARNAADGRGDRKHQPGGDPGPEREWGAGYGGGYGRSAGYGERGGRGDWGGQNAGVDPEYGSNYGGYGASSGYYESGAAYREPGYATGNYTGGQFAGRGPRNYRRSDERILEDVNDSLTRNAALDATDIEVSVSDGDVTLTGQVADRRAKRLAEDVADSCTGVHDVMNQLRIGRPPERAD